MHEKTKIFEPIPHGFRMTAHRPAKNSGPFHWVERIYGGPMTTTIDASARKGLENFILGKCLDDNRRSKDPNKIVPADDQE
jgi:hypothetical protein